MFLLFATVVYLYKDRVRLKNQLENIPSNNTFLILAGFRDLRSPACVAELSWASGRVIHHVLGFRFINESACRSIRITMEIFLVTSRIRTHRGRVMQL